MSEDAISEADSNVVQQEPSMREEATNVPEPFTVPEAFADKPWASNIKSQEDLYNQFDNLQGLIGKKTIPGEDATEEQLDEFYSHLRPESPESYDLSLPEGVDADINEEVQNEYKKFFHENGFTQKQARALYEFHIEQEMKNAPDREALDAEFAELMKNKYGDKAEDAVKIAHVELANSSQEAKEAFKNAPNALMVAVIDILNENRARYSKEDTSPGDGGGSPSKSLDEKVSEANKLRLSPEAKDPFHPDNKATLARLKQLDDEIMRAHK